MRTYHSDVTLNFMLNRLARVIDAEELTSFAQRYEDIDGWVEASLDSADRAERDGRKIQAAYYYRGAEFFMAPDHPRKLEAYERFMALHDDVHLDVGALRSKIPYEGGELGIIDIPARGAERDVILACSGFDGLIEEMVDPLRALAASGYRVVLYEGPGQGSALRRSHLTMIAEWERPVAAVLNHSGIGSCTLLGLSLGGYLAPRAAAFEPRAKRLIAWGPMYDFLDCFRPRMGNEAFAGLLELVEAGQEEAVNTLLGAAMRSSPTAEWSIQHGMHTCGANSPFGFIKWAQRMNLRAVAERIQQDTLIIAGTEDHLVPSEQVWQQASALPHAHSVTVRLFTAAEHASEHCQVTNTGIVIAEIVDWLDRLDRRDEIA